jgi:cell division protein FtsL
VAASGERKSSTVSAMSAPIFTYQTERQRELLPAHAKHEAEREGLEEDYRRALQDRKQTMDKEKRREAIERAAAAKLKIAELKPPPAACFIAQDVTPEGLTRLMSETGGFAAIVDSEGGDIFESMIGRYGKDSASPNIGAYLKGYDGEPVISIRASKERQPAPIERASLSIVAATQPATIATLGKRSELRDRGLVARMLFGFCLDSRVGSRSPFEPAPDAAVKRRYEDAITAALRIERLPTPYTVEIGKEAQHELDRLHHEIEPRLAPGGDLAETPEWSQKLKGKLLRIAALLHLFDRIHDRNPWETPVTGDVMQRAGRLLPYFIAHARRAFGLMRQRPEYATALPAPAPAPRVPLLL